MNPASRVVVSALAHSDTLYWEIGLLGCLVILLVYSLIHLVYLWRRGLGRHPIKALREQPGFSLVSNSGLYGCDRCNGLVEFREQHLHSCIAQVQPLPREVPDWAEDEQSPDEIAANG